MRTRTFPGLGFDPAPGSVADTEAVLARLERVSSTVDASAHGLRRAARAGSWRGAAAAAFRSDAGQLATGLDDLVAALRSASRAVSAWQSRLMANQREADELEAAARRLRADPAAAAELARVLDRAGRLQARHLRQASAAAAAVRSGAEVSITSVGTVSAWPVEPAGWQAGRVSRWTGDLATGLATMPPWLSGEEGGFGGSGRWPGFADLPGDGVVGSRPVPGDLAELAGRPGLVGPAGLDGLPGRVGGPGWVGPALLPGSGLPVRPFEPAVTAPAGWLDTAPAPALRTPLERSSAPRLPDPAAAPPAAHNTVRPAELTDRTADRTASRTVDRTVDRTADRVADRTADRPGGRGPVRVGGEGPPARADADGREHTKTSGRGGEAHGSGRPGGQPALHTPAGPSGPAGLAHPPGQQVATGGDIAHTTGAPPPLPAPPTPPDQTVEQQALSPTPPGQPVPAEHRPAAPVPTGPEPAGQGGPAGSGGTDQGQRPNTLGADTGRGADSARALEPGRTSGAEPRPGAPANPSQPAHAPAKSRDTDLAAVLLGPVADEPDSGARRMAEVRAFLLTSPGARPVLAVLRTDGEPIFVTGLTRCASALPACAAPLPAAASPDVY